MLYSYMLVTYLQFIARHQWGFTLEQEERPQALGHFPTSNLQYHLKSFNHHCCQKNSNGGRFSVTSEMAGWCSVHSTCIELHFPKFLPPWLCGLSILGDVIQNILWYQVRKGYIQDNTWEESTLRWYALFSWGLFVK